MFEKFGLLKSVEELNAAAEGFLKEGDTESIKLLVEENGIDAEDAKDYEDGLAEEFATLTTAAIGRLKVIRREKINKESNSQYRQNQTYILQIVKGMILEPSVAAGIMARENIIQDTVDALKKHSVQTGTDEDMRNLIRAMVTGEDELKKTAEEVVKRYSDKGED